MPTINKNDIGSKKLLNFSFLITSFLSTLWLFYCLKNIEPDISSATKTYPELIMILVPILILWVIFAIIKNYTQNLRNNTQMKLIVKQIKKNTESIGFLTEAILSHSKEVKSSFILQQADILISDINEILSEIIKRSNSISSLQMEQLLTRVSKGERWLIAKSLIETNNYQSDFVVHLLEKAQKDSILKGSILEFYVLYSDLYELLEKYDLYKILYNSVKYGALGKAHSILSPIIETLSNTPVEKQNNKEEPNPAPSLPKRSPSVEAKENSDFPSFLTSSSYVSTKKRPTKTETPTKEQPKDKINVVKEEPIAKPTPDVSIKKTTIISNFNNTNSALKNLKQDSKKTNVITVDELEKEINASPDNNFDEKKIPFGDWLDEKKN